MMTRLLRFLSLALLLTAAACSKTADKQAETTTAKPADAATLKREYTAVRDTLDSCWARMIASDDEKIFYQKRLLEEISYVPGADITLINRLQAANARFKARRYAQATVVSDSIDAYDHIQDTLLLQVRELVGKYSESANRPVIGELMADIQRHDDMVVHFRGAYDQAARAYNAWLQQHEGQLPAAANARPVPLFSLTGA